MLTFERKDKNKAEESIWSAITSSQQQREILRKPQGEMPEGPWWKFTDKRSRWDSGLTLCLNVNWTVAGLFNCPWMNLGRLGILSVLDTEEDEGEQSRGRGHMGVLRPSVVKATRVAPRSDNVFAGTPKPINICDPAQVHRSPGRREQKSCQSCQQKCVWCSQSLVLFVNHLLIGRLVEFCYLRLETYKLQVWTMMKVSVRKAPSWITSIVSIEDQNSTPLLLSSLNASYLCSQTFPLQW